MTALDRFSIQGHISRGFEAVRVAFTENFVRPGQCGIQAHSRVERSLLRVPQPVHNSYAGLPVIRPRCAGRSFRRSTPPSPRAPRRARQLEILTYMIMFALMLIEIITGLTLYT